MGVDGFWPIVSSRGKRVTLDILADKIIAIDASIWIYQFANALRDANGEPLKAAHIVGFFKRICKLLFLRIKPVFVFDGPPIPLKFASLRKRHDDTVPDAVFRKAARQLLLQNLQAMKATPVLAERLPHEPHVLEPDSEGSVDEVHILTDSSDNDMSPSRQLRLSVPEAFRGFMSERRTLDSVSVPISPERHVVRLSEHKEVEIEARIDEDALKDLPLHEQYRGLLEARSALLSQGRRRALNIASRMGSVSAPVDLDQLSLDQIKAVVELAKVTDMSKAARREMSREEHKDEVYVPASFGSEQEQFRPPFKRSRKRNDQAYLEDACSDQHSVLATARMVKRSQLLFNADEVKKETKVEVVEESISEEELSAEAIQANLFGDEWNDVAVVKTEQSETPHMVADALKKGDDLSKLKPEESFTEKSDTSMAQESAPVNSEEPVRGISESCESVVFESSDSEEFNEEEVASQSDASSEAIWIAAESESETDMNEPVPPLVEVSAPHVETPTASVTEVKPPDFTPSSVVGDVPTDLVETVSDAELLLFTELEDIFPRFTSDLEEENFENRARERITVEPSENAYEEIQELLTAFGIPWVSAPADAEAQCAFLCSAGLADGVISDDSDTLIYGSPIVFRHLYIGESTVELFKLSNIGFDRNELISLALLLGCDFTVGVRGIGPVNATEIVRVYSGIDGLTRFRQWAESITEDPEVETDPNIQEFKVKHANYRAQWLFPDDFPSQEVWDVFAQPLVSTEMTPFSWAQPDEQLVVDTVTGLSDMRHDQVDQILTSTMAQYRTAQVQRRITDYFSPTFERGSVAEIVSKRLKSAFSSNTTRPS